VLSVREFLILLAAIAGLPGAPAKADEPRVTAAPEWTPDVRAARSYAAGRSGSVAFSVRTRKRAWEHRPRSRVNTASVIKAMLLVAYLDQPSVRKRPLEASDRALLAPMIRYSDNDTASRVREIVGDPQILRLARRARMRDFGLAPAWGLSQTTAADQARWFLRLAELTPERHRNYVLALLGSVVPEQRWGVADVRPRGWELHFKGGWGSGTGAVSHQVALLRRGHQRVSMAIMTTGSPSHGYSQETLRGVARRLLRGLSDSPRRERPAPVAALLRARSAWPAYGLRGPDRVERAALETAAARAAAVPPPEDRDPFTPEPASRR
jgi:hypothetical protein